MAKTKAAFTELDSQSMQAVGTAIGVLPDPTGAIERTASGINVKADSITESMLASAFKALVGYLGENETVTGTWAFSNLPTVSADPTNDNQLARKAYVDGIAQGLDVKESVRVATTANITLSGEQTIDGVSVVSGDRVLVKDQSTGSQNGIYVAAVGAWSRSADANVSDEVTSGMFTFVEEGSTNASTGWVLTTANPIVLATTSLSFSQFSGAGTITAGAGLTKTGSTIDFVAADDSLTVNADSVAVAVDDSSIETASGVGIRVKAGGITESMLATAFKDLVAYLGENEAVTGAWTFNTTIPTTSQTPTNASDFATKGYVDSVVTTARQVETFTLDGTDISNKYVTLSQTPAAAGRVILTIKHAPDQFYGDDYEMDGVNTDRLTWDNLGLDGILASGDKLTVEYDA